MLSFLGFLEQRDSLSGGSLGELSDALEELGELFLDACEHVAGCGIQRAPLTSTGAFSRQQR